MLITAIVIGQVSYYTPLLGSNKERTRSTQTLVNSDYTGLKDFQMGIALHPFIVFLKNLTFFLFRGNVQLLR